MNQTAEVTLRVAPTRRKAEEWALVLVAQGLCPRVVRSAEGFALLVPVSHLEPAAAALTAYEQENERETAPAEPASRFTHVPAALATCAALIAFFLVTGPREPGVRWFAQGSADAERILLGEPWRVVTALTLHADLGHVLSNAVVGAVFLAALFEPLGPGLGSALVLVSGAGGNWVNAYLHGALHVSVGASTAVFGAVGLLGALGVIRRRRSGTRGRRIWVPVAAGIGLLAMLGAGKHTDLGAHLFGFLFGALLGLPVGLTVRRAPPFSVQVLLALAALGTVLGCWVLALTLEPALR